jgi:uncharacterized protein (DUF2147 family)
MNKLGIAAVIALMSSAASAETFNIPIGGGKLRIDARECRDGKVCANVSFSNGSVRLGNHQFTIDKSTIERLVPKPKADEEAPPPNSPPSATPAPQPPVAMPAPQAATPAPQPATPAQPYTSPYRAPQPAVEPAPAAPQSVEPKLVEPRPVEPARPVIAAVPPAAEPISTPAKTVDPNSPIGEWITEKGEGRIRIEECGPNLCGYVATAKPNETDSKNPNPALRGRPMLGLPILINMKPTKTNRWDGKIYNTRDGATYTSHMAMRNPNTLRVEGCLMMFCGGQNWTRAQ